MSGNSDWTITKCYFNFEHNQKVKKREKKKHWCSNMS